MSTQVNLRVTLVQAPKWTIYTPSYALALLAGNLRSHGFPVAVLDLDIDLYSAVREEHKGRWLDSSGSFWDSDENVAALAVEYSAVFDGFVSRILATAPDVVGFSTKVRSRCMTLLLAEKIKAERPGVYVILGGPEITGGVARFLEPCPFIDAVCTQEADLSFPAFLKSYHAHGRQPQPEPGFAYRDASGKIVDCGPIAGPPGWQQIPFADYSDFDFGRYQNPSAITMMLSRGCINRCSFCSESVSFLRYRPRPAENIHEEIKFHARTSNARRPLRIYFNDSLVNGDLEQLECLADLLIADPVEGGVQFSGMMLIREKMTDELLRKLARAGMVETLFGVETGSPDMIRRMRKNFDLDDAERIIRVASESGIMTAVSIIFGHPGETESDYFQTIAFMKRIAPHVDTFLLNTLGLFGESAISRDLAGYGIDPGTADVMQWTGDGGANTYEVRRNRFLNALTLFRDKAADIGGFGDGAIEGDPLRPLRERIKATPARVADAVRLAAEFEAAMPPEHPAPGPNGFLDIIERGEDGGLRLVGWAIEPCSGMPARHVVLTGDDGRMLGYATAELRRADVALAIGNPRAKFAGWEAVISPASAAGRAPESLSAFVYDPEGDCRYRLRSAVGQGEPPGQAEDEERRLASYRSLLAGLTAQSLCENLVPNRRDAYSPVLQLSGQQEPPPSWNSRIRRFGAAISARFRKPCLPPEPPPEIPKPPQTEPADLVAKGVVLIRSSGLFDADFYVGQGAACGNCDPLAHYLEIGWKHGLDPGGAFSTTGYLDAHPDVCAAGLNPLLHYMLHGRQERRECPDPRRVLKANPVRTPVEPAGSDWDALGTSPASGEPVVDVIVPVFQGCAETLCCLFSVLNSQSATPFQLIVIDDCSPDAGLSAELKRLARAGRIFLHTNPENEGFVRSCNRAMALHPDRDVVLLNSDTEVFGDWLDRLRAAATRRDAVGTVTPFTNSRAICSYPRFNANNPEPLEIDDAELDKLAAELNRGLDAEMPTGVGFCLYLRRACLDEIGLFDADSFPRGYGEESDFCRRAAMRGWRNILAADVFVRHFGGVSFGDEKVSLTREAGKVIERLHPGYHDAVEEFNREDPLRPLRMRLDVARLERAALPLGAVLLVAHTRGGGTEKHVQDLGSLLREEGRAVVFCRPDPDAAGRIVLAVQGIEAPNLPGFCMGSDAAHFGDFLRKSGIVHVHIHGLVDFGTVASGFFREACRQAGLAYDVTVHDYQSICPRLHLVDKEGRYCGEPELDDCEVCAADPKLLAGAVSVKEWRREHSALLSGARRVFVPEVDVARRLRRHLPDLHTVIRPHPEPRAPEHVHKVSRPQAEGARRILILGAIGREKGSELLVRTAQCASALGLDLNFVLLGYTDRDDDLCSIGNVSVLGKYDDADLPGRLRAIDADLVWFPAICPETWSYTLSRVLDAGLFPVAFDLGSIASRIRTSGWGKILPMERMLDPEAVAQDLAAVAVPDRVPPIPVQGGRYPPPVSETYYGGLGPTERKKLK